MTIEETIEIRNELRRKTNWFIYHLLIFAAGFSIRARMKRDEISYCQASIDLAADHQHKDELIRDIYIACCVEKMLKHCNAAKKGKP